MARKKRNDIKTKSKSFEKKYNELSLGLKSRSELAKGKMTKEIGESLYKTSVSTINSIRTSNLNSNNESIQKDYIEKFKNPKKNIGNPDPGYQFNELSNFLETKDNETNENKGVKKLSNIDKTYSLNKEYKNSTNKNKDIKELSNIDKNLDLNSKYDEEFKDNKNEKLQKDQILYDNTSKNRNKIDIKLYDNSMKIRKDIDLGDI